MNATLRNILNLAFVILSVISIFAFYLMTHALVINALADEIVPVR